jgi:hypothetical protein
MLEGLLRALNPWRSSLNNADMTTKAGRKTTREKNYSLYDPLL